MSYCVNCGVELEKSLKKCPLCNTPVINPNHTREPAETSPYAEEKGIVEQVARVDLIIFFSIVFGATAVCCALLNYFIFNNSKWSLLVIGVCGVLWMLTVPPLIVKNIKKRAFAFLNCLMLCLYLCLIGLFIDKFDWLINFALPLMIIILVLLELFLTVCGKSKSFMVIGSLFFAEVAALCVSIELLVDHVTGKTLTIQWSAIVVTVCTVIIVMCLTIMSRSRIRSQLHRRFHL